MANAVVVDATTGEVEERPLTAEEQTQRDADAQAEADREAAEEQARADEQAAAQAWQDALSEATTVAQIRDVLLGVGLPAQAETRRK